MASTSRARSVTAKEPCRICGASKRCLVGNKGPLCYRQGGPGAMELTDRQGETYWLHPAEGSNPAPMPTPTDQPPECGPPELLDMVYRWLQGELELQYRHHQNLIGRGLTKEAIKAHGFRTLPGEWAVKSNLAKLAAERWPDRWQAVPGFALSKKGKPALVGAPGLALFGRDLDGKIVAVKIRLDEPADGCRYRWLSGAGGPGVGSPATWWAPLTRPAVAGEVRVCEGMLKAVVSAELTGVPAIAAGAGVSSLAGPEVVAMLRRLRPTLIRLAPDADALDPGKEVCRQTRTALSTLEHLAADLGARLVVDTWAVDAGFSPKGVDDALAAGLTLAELSPADYRQRLETLVKKTEMLPPEERDSKLSQPSPLPQTSNLSHSEGDRTGDRLALEPSPNCHQDPPPQTLEGALMAVNRFSAEVRTKDMLILAGAIDAASRGVQVAAKSRKRILGALQRYECQLAAQGINIHDVTATEQALRDSDDSEAKKDPGHQADTLIELAASAKLIKYGCHHYLSMLSTNPDGSFGRDTKRFSDKGNGVYSWLQYSFYLTKGRAPSSEAMKAAVSTLEARCEFEGAQERVWLRTAEIGDSGDGDRRLFHDLGDDHKKVVVISASGWQVTQDVPVYFWRPKNMQALPEPVKGGSLLELRQFLNVPDESSWILIAAFLVYSFVATTPHPLLILEGEEGSCKTWAARILRMLVDPNGALTRRPPRNEEDLSLFALNGHLPVIDNIASIEEWLSDGLCAITTGNGWGRRQKFTDESESVVSVVRPVILTGLGGLHGKSDLMDRTIKVIMQRISPSERKPESDLAQAFEEARPRILGAIYDVLVAGLANRGKVPLPSLPRMADFARFIIEAESALPWEPGQFMEAFKSHRIDQVLTLLESSSLASALRDLMLCQSRWEGTATQLHTRLSEFREFRSKLPGPLSLKPAILKLRPSLRHLGIEVSELRTKNSRLIVLEKESKNPSPPSPEAQTQVDKRFAGDTTPVTNRHQPVTNCHPATKTENHAAAVHAAGDLF